MVYGLSMAGALYIGMQAYAAYRQQDPRPTPSRAASAAPARTLSEAQYDDPGRSEDAPKDPDAPVVTVRPADSVPPAGEPPASDETGPALAQLPESGPPLLAPSRMIQPPEGAGSRAGEVRPGPLPPLEIDRGSGKRREVALTFDAGSDYRPVKQILAALAQEGVRSTFFLTGEWVGRNPRSTRKISEAGHELGNHSWDHAPFTNISSEAIRDQLRRTEAIVQETVGRSTYPYFRPPHGARDGRVLRAVGDEGFLTVYWSLDSRDSVDRGITADQIRDRILQQAAPGSIVLLHCGSQPSADALPEILKGLREMGLTPVTLGRLLAQ